MQLLRCALQITLGLLLCLAASCAKDEAAPKSDTAGLVIAVQGEVSATRPGGVARLLHVDDTVFRDDTIVTGPNSSLEVELSHNGARWQLSAENERRVDSSLAWSAKRQSVAALEPGQDIKTGSAGRNTTHEAAESRETLVPESEPVPDLEPGFAMGDNSSSDGDSIASKRRAKDAKPKPSQHPSVIGGGGTATSAALPSPKKGAPERQQASTPSDRAAAANETRQEPSAVPSPSAGTTSSAEAESEDEAKPSEAADSEGGANQTPPSLRDHVLTLAKQCRAKHGGRGALLVSVTVASGTASKVRVSGPDALEATQSCVDAALRSSSALPAGPPLTTTISLP